MRKSKHTGRIPKIIQKAAQSGGILDQLISNLSAKEKRQLAQAFKAVDQRFVLEKATLLKDTMSEILLQRDHTPNMLLQRNAWTTIDALAMHWDASGFTSAFKTAAPKMFRGVRIDDPRVISLEYDLLTEVMGGAAEVARWGGLSFPEVEEVIKHAEKHRAQAFRDIRRPGLDFQHAMAGACGRHDDMFKVVIHSPQAWKMVVAAVALVVNFVAAGVGLLLVETLVGLIIGAAVAILTVVITWACAKGC